MKRILISTNSYPPNFIGGAELVAHEHAKILVRRGFEVAVFAGDFQGEGERHSVRRCEHEGVTVYRVATTSEDYDPFFLNFYHSAVDNEFSALLKNFRPDVVHFHNILGLSARLPILAKEAGSRVVCTLHDHWGYCLRQTAVRRDGDACYDTTRCHDCLPQSVTPIRLRKDLISLAFDHVDIFLSPSRFLAERYIWSGLPREWIRVVPNGIDTRRFAPRARARPGISLRLMYAGHLGAHKGVATLLLALSRLQSGERVHLYLIGKGPEEEACRDLVRTLGLESRVTFQGLVAPSEMPVVYNGMDILVLPSIWDENQPVCIMEAMASGLPVIASRKGGIPEIVGEGESGLLVPAGDADAWAEAIDRFVSNPDLIVDMGAAGRRRVEGMTYDHQVDEHLTIYDVQMWQAMPRVARKSITALVGNYEGTLDFGSRQLLRSRRHAGEYLVPVSWLSRLQHSQIGKHRKISLEYRWVGRIRRWMKRRLPFF